MTHPPTEPGLVSFYLVDLVGFDNGKSLERAHVACLYLCVARHHSHGHTHSLPLDHFEANLKHQLILGAMVPACDGRAGDISIK